MSRDDSPDPMQAALARIRCASEALSALQGPPSGRLKDSARSFLLTALSVLRADVAPSETIATFRIAASAIRALHGSDWPHAAIINTLWQYVDNIDNPQAYRQIAAFFKNVHQQSLDAWHH